ncbi:hypothetical protein Hanom_Chr05g00424241 [Helianthus anomalus]
MLTTSSLFLSNLQIFSFACLLACIVKVYSPISQLSSGTSTLQSYNHTKNKKKNHAL